MNGFKPMGVQTLVPRGAALGRLPSRLTGLRRQLYEPRWATKIITAGQKSDVVFFRDTSSHDRISNVEQAGANSVHEGLTIFRILLMFWPGASEPDLVAFYRTAIMRVKVQKDKAYELLAQTHGASGIGFTGATSLVNYGEAAPGKAASIGQLDVGPGDSFEIRLVFGENLPTQNDQILTIQLEAMADEPIS